MNKKTIRICSLDTIYSLFLYLVKFGYNEKDIFIFSGGIPSSIKKHFNYISFPNVKLENGMKISSNKGLKGLYKNIKGYLSYGYGILKLRFLLFLKTFNKNVELYGQAHTTFSYMFYEFKNSNVIEDGTGNYHNLKNTPKKNYILEKILHFCGIYIFNIKEGFGTHPNIKKVYLTNEDAPDIIQDKVELIDVNHLWASKSKQQKEKILEIFNLSNIKNTLNDDCVLFLTQPFSEENLLPFDEEIAIYKELQNQEENIIIKTHPREKKDYSTIFPNVQIIDEPFPVELLKYIGLNVKKIITLSSSAALNFKDYADIEIYTKKTSNENVNNGIEFLKEKLGK